MAYYRSSRPIESEDDLDDLPIDTVSIYLNWKQSVIDPLQYKPLAPTLEPKGLVIEVKVPRKYVVSYDETSFSAILTPAGLAYVSRVISSAISSSYQE